MKRKRKDRLISGLAQSVEAYYPELKDTFICPTCLGHLQASKSLGISEAHILPQAIGGQMTTLLCRIKCNSTFGRKQDLWLGEYLRAHKGGPFNLKTQTGHFEVEGRRMNGYYDIDPANGGIRFFIREQLNPPGTGDVLKAVTAKARETGSLSVTLSFPLQANMEQANCGFLTAAYLMWFKALGYAWALQTHLGPVREQIRNPEQRTLPSPYTARCEETPSEEPWLGTADIDGELALAAGLADRIILLPPVDRPNFYDLLPKRLSGLKITARPLPIWLTEGVRGPLCVVARDRLVIAPDTLVRGAPGPVLHFPSDGSPMQVLYPIGKEDFEQHLLQEGVKSLNLDAKSILVAQQETGRRGAEPPETEEA